MARPKQHGRNVRLAIDQLEADWAVAVDAEKKLIDEGWQRQDGQWKHSDPWANGPLDHAPENALM